ncbi:MAG: hypothetical protein LBQ44_01490 [Treponema sp.]|nr:hypothetical protein [Treponema sp.]
MDERRKIIGELDEKRKESLRSCSQTLEDLGKSLVERLEEARFSGGEGGEYRRVSQEIADSEASIASIRGALARIKELDEEISVKAEERSNREEEAAVLYIRLGEGVLEGAFPDSGEIPGKKQLELILSRNNTLEERLQDLEDRGGAGFFSWFSRGVQTLVINSSMRKNFRQLDRIYLQAGKAYAQRAESRAPDQGTLEEAAALLRDTLAQRRIIAELEGAAAELEEERRRIRNSFGFREKPSARIKTLEQRNFRRREDLRGLYLKVGEDAAAEKLSGADLADEDRAKLAEARRYKENADKDGREIEKLEAAIAVDQEREKIVKLERAVSGQKERIAAGERNLEDLNRRIEDAHERIKQIEDGQKTIQDSEQGGTIEGK